MPAFDVVEREGLKLFGDAGAGSSVSPGVASFVSSRSSTPISWSRQSTTARSMTFLSSRTLPGQRYFNNCSRAAAVKPLILRPVSALNFCRK